jgi:hypothetical protein
MKHGEGQGAETWEDAGWLTLSGITSLIPLIIAAEFLLSHTDAGLLASGLLKAPIWCAWAHSRVQQIGPWFEPTRFSAMTFGAVVGATLAFA